MTQPLRFGVGMFMNIPWATLVERAQYAEQLGFDSLWVPDHMVSWAQPDAPYLEAWTALAGLALHTTRIRLGTLVTHFTYRNPVLLTRQALMVDYMSNGRLELGIGAGGVPIDYSTSGVGPWAPGEQVGRFREGVELIDSLLRGEQTTYTGRYYQIQETVLRPKAIQQPRPRLTLAALKPATMKIAARYADSWNSFTGGMDMMEGQEYSADHVLTLTRQRRQLFDATCAAIGRNPDTVRHSLLVWPLGKPTEPWASVDAFEAFVGQYAEAGIDEFILRYPLEVGYPGHEIQSGIFERVATDILPKLRTAAL